ncbi:MAG: hypothetical protein ACWA5P_03010 [bacterium]
MREAGQYNISINQLADFSKGTEGKKRGIIRQQKNPNPLKVFWYQLAKARIRKTFALGGDLEPILNGIEELKSRNLTKKRQIDDRTVSLEAMRKFIELQLPKILRDSDYEILKKPKVKSIYLRGVEVIVSPDLIIRAKIDDKMYIGGIKIHVAKHNQFDSRQQSYVAVGIKEYLSEVVAKNGEQILPELCLSIDIFRGAIISAPKELSKRIKEMEIICEEIKQMWSAA